MRTPAYARLQFLKAKYYGKRYERFLSTIFCPRQFLTSAKKVSYYEQMQQSAKHCKAGIAGSRKITGDGDLCKLFSTNYPIGGGECHLTSLSRSVVC